MLRIPLPTGSKIFYVNENYTFGSLRELMAIETQKSVTMEFPQPGLDLDDSLSKFLLEDR